ncbi:hypothetical protein Daus18300_004162 [Diaporthe australafricana]|uniref:Protein kinase domain-containing protein n=1 Tax=Diaporthe australafricana TaxID=127596 RepID=A0ABR3XAM7_9PEZI
MPPKRPKPSPKRVTPNVLRGIVMLPPNSSYRVEKPRLPAPRWSRNNQNRLVSRVPRRPNTGGYGDLEAFYHVERAGPDEVLPPPQTLWRQRYGDDHTVSYRPLWAEIAQNLVEPLRMRQDLGSDAGDKEGDVGVPYLFSFDENAPLDENGEPYVRWRPYEILANGGYGVVITYVNDALNFAADSIVENEDKKVAKFNYKGGDLVDIMQSVVSAATLTEMLMQDRRGSSKNSSRRSSGGRDSNDSNSSQGSYSHFQAPTPGMEKDVDVADTFRQETMILEILEMTGSPHVPTVWKLADPPQDGTLCTMEYIPGARTLNEQLDTDSNQKVPIRLVWEAVFCLSKALSVMAYGGEDPAPSHRVYGWNQIVHLDWSAANIFVQLNSPKHTCSHGPCFMVGDFGFALVVPNEAKPKDRFRRAQLQKVWHSVLNPELPEGDVVATRSFDEMYADPVTGHFSHKSNIFLMARVWNENLGGNQVGRIGIMRYLQDGLTPAEHIQLGLDLESQVPDDERLGEPLGAVVDDFGPELRGYLDVAESILQQPIAQNLSVRTATRRQRPRKKRRCSGWWGQASLGPVGSFSEFLTCDLTPALPEGKTRKLREKLLAQISPFVA